MTILRDAELMSAAELLPHQQACWELRREYVATNSEFYKAHWGRQNPPASLLELPCLPLSSKAQLRASQSNYPLFGNYLTANPTTVTRLHRTSGTTGQAMNLATNEGFLVHSISV